MLQKPEDSYCYREKRCHLRLKYIKPRFSNLGHGIVTANAHVGMYAVTADTARKIELSGSIRNHRPVHYSSVLWVDVDSIVSAKAIVKAARMHNLDFNVYFSGNKGMHLAIRRDAVPSSDLFARDKAIVQDLFKGSEGYLDVDTSIYHPMHVLRAVSCKHEKTGKVKRLVYKFRGGAIPNARDYEPSLMARNPIHFEPCDWGIDIWERVLTVMATHQVHSYNTRYHALWGLARDLCKVDCPITLIDSLVRLFNDRFNKPHQPEEVQRAVSDGVYSVKGQPPS